MMLTEVLPETLPDAQAVKGFFEGVSEEELEEFTDSVLENQGRLMANNFVKLDRERVYKIYKECF